MTLCTSLCLCSVPDHIFKFISRWWIMHIQICTHLPNHCYVPVAVIPKAQMIPVFLRHVDNDTGEKINRLTTIPRSIKWQSSFSKRESDFQNRDGCLLVWQMTVTSLEQHGSRKEEWAEVLHDLIKKLGWGGMVSKTQENNETVQWLVLILSHKINSFTSLLLLTRSTFMCPDVLDLNCPQRYLLLFPNMETEFLNFWCAKSHLN